MKSSALAYSNIAFIKYWGKSDPLLRLPLNNSISMNLSNLQTVTTVEFSKRLKTDDILIDGQKHPVEVSRVIDQLNRLRKLAKTHEFAKVVSQNNFPSSSGLSSSASGFAALTLATTASLGLNLNEKELSIAARLASGSACRSIPAGFVEWVRGDSSASSYAYSIFPASYWPILDVVVIVSNRKKDIPTSIAQKYAQTSPFMDSRLASIPEKISKLKKAIKQKNFPQFGEIVETEALELHAVIMTQTPSQIYFLPETVSLFHNVRNWRKAGLIVYFTVNTGHDVHLLCRQKDKAELLQKLSSLSFVKKIIINHPAGPAKIINKHLF